MQGDLKNSQVNMNKFIILNFNMSMKWTIFWENIRNQKGKQEKNNQYLFKILAG